MECFLVGSTINFWKLVRPLAIDNTLLSLQRCCEEEVDGVAKFPVEEIVEELSESIPFFDSLSE